ncbi:MAG: hypothetical protein AAFV49_04870 [Pseudomonadota bacterium]
MICGIVKQLEWQEPKERTAGCWLTRTCLGVYRVGYADGWFAVLEDGLGWECPNEPRFRDARQAAQAACQAHFEAQIIAALKPTTASSETCRQALEEAAGICDRLEAEAMETARRVIGAPSCGGWLARANCAAGAARDIPVLKGE